MGKKIAIIGAGWAGIGCARILKEAGHSIDIFEKNDDVGGTWHPSNCYADLRIHAPSKQVGYFDFPLPSNIDPTERVSAETVFLYLKSYCKHIKIYDQIKFSTIVNKVNYISDKKKLVVFFQNKDSNKLDSQEYDFAIYTEGATNRKLPKIENQENFSGKVYHSFDVSSEKLNEFINENKKITIVGGSKTATDFALSLSTRGYKFSWIYNKPYWFMRLDPFRKFFKARYRGKRGNLFYKYGFIFCLFSFRYFNAFPGMYIFRFFRMMDTFGKKHSDYRKFHLGFLDDNQLRELRRLNAEYGIADEITNFEKSGVKLKSGKLVETDIVICCTGSGSSPPDENMEIQIDSKPFSLANISKVYDSKVIPQIPNLIFTVYSPFTLGVTNGLMQGKWIERYITLDLNPIDLEKNGIEFGYPFFRKGIAQFDSKELYFKRISMTLSIFFKTGQLSMIKYIFWFANRYFFFPGSTAPLDFAIPKNFRKKSK